MVLSRHLARLRPSGCFQRGPAPGIAGRRRIVQRHYCALRRGRYRRRGADCDRRLVYIRARGSAGERDTDAVHRGLLQRPETAVDSQRRPPNRVQRRWELHYAGAACGERAGKHSPNSDFTSVAEPEARMQIVLDFCEEVIQEHQLWNPVPVA